MSRFSTEPLNFACSRREFPGKLFAIAAGALLMSEHQSKVSVSQTEVQPKAEPEVSVNQTQVQAKFRIGDLVSSYWEDEEDPDAPDNATDFGEILGMRWVSSREPGLDPNTWVYFVRWTHSTCGLYSCYPCYDGEPTRECDLTLVS